MLPRRNTVNRHNVNEMPEVEVLGEYVGKKKRKQKSRERAGIDAA